MEFIRNKIYKRKELHDEYGGNRQSGICPSSEHPVIFIFSGNTGGKYGYEDGWDNENIFRYSGEGQIGDMEFTRGNKSILNHKEDGKNMVVPLKNFSGHFTFMPAHILHWADENPQDAMRISTGYNLSTWEEIEQEDQANKNDRGGSLKNIITPLIDLI